jgi:DegV family protein with EDD domain
MNPKVQIRYLDGLRFQLAILSGCKEVISHEQELNDINVFPIPDKDTGSNLKRTLSPLLDKPPQAELSLKESSQQIASLAVASAMGYSGIIFSQFLSGLAEGLEDKIRVSVRDIPKALILAVDKAYKSIEQPQEGTVLSVFKTWKDEIFSLTQKTEDFLFLLKNSLEKAKIALAETQYQLDVLQQHKVVDAGGKAFVFFLEGISQFIQSASSKKIFKEAYKRRPGFLSMETKVQNRFCVECCLRKKHFDRTGLVKKLNDAGSELIFYSSSDFAKIRINTNDPEEIFKLAAEYGELTSKRTLDNRPSISPQAKKPVALVSDTTCDISDQYIEENDIYFVPVKVQISDRVYTDKVDLIPEEFYELMSSSSAPPKTSQPARMDFVRVYKSLLTHYQSILSVHLTGQLSGTFQTARQAAKDVAPDKIFVLDGKSLSVGLGLILVEAIKSLQQNLDVTSIVSHIQKAIGNVEIFLGIPTLKYLVRGGRVPKTKGQIATLFNITPILCVNRDGIIVPIGKTFGKKRLVTNILNITLDKIEKIQDEHLSQKTSSPKDVESSYSIAVVHSNAPHLADQVVKKIRERLDKEVVMVKNASPVLGAHAGPGAVAVAILKNPTADFMNNSG